MKTKAILLLAGGLLLSGCQTTGTPEWALNPTADTNMSLYAVGHGGTLQNAKRSAMSQMNEKLWTQVESSGYVRQVVHDVNGNEDYRTQSDTVVDVKTAPLVLAGVNYNRSEQRDGIYYVEAVISRDNIIQQLQQELATIEENATTELFNLHHTDPLLWWLKNRDIETVKQNMLTRKAMLLAANNGKASGGSVNGVIELERQINTTKNQLLFSVKANKSDQWMSGFIKEHLSEQNIATTHIENKNKPSHQIVLTTHWRQSKVGDAYISTVIAKLALKNKNGKTIASSEVIATGNSILNFTRSKESASRHFSAQMSDQGLWHFLGVI